jgi:hypothetical protein
MKTIAAIAFAVFAAACTSEDASAPAQRRQVVQQEGNAQANLPSRRAFPEKAVDLTPSAQPSAKPAKPVAEAPAEPPAPAVPAGPPPLPFTYVGKLAEGGRRYAVLARDQAVFVVRAGDSLGGRYRVESVREEQVVLLSLEFGVAQPLAFSGSAVPGTTIAKPSGDDGPVQLAGPSQVTLGQIFTLNVSLNAGANATTEGGSVELRFDPKVLQLRGSGRDGESVVDGAARIEAPSNVQFRVVAQAPTATEIHVTATSADGDGNIRDVHNPTAHRLAIVLR